MNKTCKGLFYTAMVLVLMFSMTAAVFAADFGDTSGHWGEGAINTWSDRGVLQGSDGQFRPDDSITRGEMATVLSTLLGLTNTEANTFSDLPANAWYAEAILKCKAAGIINGYTDGTVRGDNPITRQEASVMIANGLAIKPSTSAPAGFTDSSDIQNWASGYVRVLSDMKIINGYPTGEFDPQGNITRASVVTMLNNAISDYITEPGSYSDRTFTGVVIVKADEVTFEGCTFESSVVIAEAIGADNKVSIKDSTIKGSIAGVEVEMEGTTVIGGVDTTTPGTDTDEDQKPAEEAPKSSGGGGTSPSRTTYYTLTMKMSSNATKYEPVDEEAEDYDEEAGPKELDDTVTMTNSSLTASTNVLGQVATMYASKSGEIADKYPELKALIADVDTLATTYLAKDSTMDDKAWEAAVLDLMEKHEVTLVDNTKKIFGGKGIPTKTTKVSDVKSGDSEIVLKIDEITYTIEINKK